MRKTRGRLNSRIYIARAAGTLLVLAALASLLGCQGVSSGGHTSQTQPPTSTLSLPVSSLGFGSVAAGTTKTLTVPATNSGTASVTVSTAVASTKYFAVTAPGLPVTIAAGQTSSLSIAFTPNAAGSFSATLTITSDASNTQVTLPLSGTGTQTSSSGQLGVNPTTLGLGSVVVGTSGSASGSLTATGADVTVNAATSNNSAFSVGGLSLPVTVPAGQSVPFIVTFSPQTTGAASATLTFDTNAQPSTTTEALTGTGLPAPVHTVNLSWNASTSQNISGYNIYRAVYATSCGSFSKINSLLSASTLYTDSGVVDGKSYCYATTAVNTSNQESAYSNIASNIQIPAP